MVDINTRCIIDMIDSRDTQDVATWLKTYPNIKTIVRDGSLSFKSAIEIAHPNAVQVNDRFHMIKNLVKAIKKTLQKIIVGRIEIPLTSIDAINKHKYLTSMTKREKIIEVKKLRKQGDSFGKIATKLQISTSTASKYYRLDESEIPKEHVSIREKEHIDAVNKVKFKIEKVKELSKKGLTFKEISAITGYSASSVSKYLSDEYSEVHGQYGVSRPGLLEPYRDQVLLLRSQGITYKEITKIIREKGYSGSIDALRGFVAKEKRIAKDILKDKEPSELIDKKHIIKLLFKPIEKINSFSKDQLEEVIKKYPIIGNLLDILLDFKKMLSEKRVEYFQVWVDKIKSFKIKELDSYINGLNSDYASTINAIKFNYSNGLAEGSVNKLKNIKRVMYGRNSFEMLRHKVIKLEKLRKFGEI